MIDLNAVLNAALTQALNDALKPLLERIATIESRVSTIDDATILEQVHERFDSTIETLIDNRIETFMDNDDLTSRIDANELDLHDAIEKTLDTMDLTDAITDAVRDLLADARIKLI